MIQLKLEPTNDFPMGEDSIRINLFDSVIAN